MGMKNAVAPENGMSGTRSYPFLPSFRLFILVMTGLNVTLVAAHYSTLHFAWVCMVNSSVLHSNVSDPEAEGYHGELLWDKSVQQILFAAYSLGTLVAWVFPGWLVDRFGPRRVGAAMLFTTSLSTLILPPLARVHYAFAAVLRIFVGAGGSGGMPLIFGVVTRWVPKNEVGLGIVFGATGFPFGQFGNMLVSGLECSALGWQWVYYFSGIFGIVFSLLWLCIFKSDPSTANRGLRLFKEKEFILQRRDRASAKERVVPWKKVLTSLPLYACMMANMANWSCFFLVGGYTATYLKEVMGVPVGSNGFLSSVPMLMYAVGRWVSGPASDRILKDRPTLSVKVFNSFCLFSSTVCFLGAAFLRPSSPAALPVTLFSINMFFAAFSTGGFHKSIPLIAPKFSGIAGSMMQSFGAFGALTMPFIISALTPHGTQEEWRKVFFYSSALATVAGVFFLLFASGEIQDWAKDPDPSAAAFSKNISSAALVPVPSSKGALSSADRRTKKKRPSGNNQTLEKKRF